MIARLSRWRGPLALLLALLLVVSLASSAQGTAAVAVVLLPLWWIALALGPGGRLAATADPLLPSIPFLRVAHGRAPPAAHF